ncbi:MAG: tripartite tricarboxylate transporter permease [archaeon]|nr:tripartite tricarboxylate transporter permease [archaeon]
MGPELIFAVVVAGIIGAMIGTFTGLVPGIHVNTAATLLLGAYPAFEQLAESLSGPGSAPIIVACCITSASVVHSFVDFVPSVFIGVPDADETLSVLPGHRLFQEGRGMVAVRSAAIGSVVGSISAIALAIPLQWALMCGGTGIVDDLTLCVLLVVIGTIILTSEDPLISGMLLALSGVLGIVVQTGIVPVFSFLGDGTMLFPLLTGLFGLPPLLERSSRRRPVRQRDPMRDPVGPMPGLKGVATGIVAGWFPGVTSTAGALMASRITRETDPARFISMTASIGTVTSVFSLVTLSVSGSGRSGTSMAVKSIVGDSLFGFCSDAFLLLLFCMALASVLGYGATIVSGRFMMGVSERVPEKLMNDSILVLIVALVTLFTGPFGLCLLVVSAAMGMIPPHMGVSRVCLTGCLTVPVLFGLFL